MPDYYRRRTKRLALLGVALLALAGVAGTAIAGHVTGSVKSYTGCLVSKDGVIIKIKEGDAPSSPCTGGMVQVHFGGGDITKISVSGGLTGGGDNGEVTISLDPKFSLPQNCAAPNNVAKWNGTAWACAADNDTTYTAGTGLRLSGTQFSVHPDYQVKNTPDCASGQFATGFDPSGNIACATPPAASLHWQWVGPASRGLPDDGRNRTIVSAGGLPSGTYLAMATGQVGSQLNVKDLGSVECYLLVGAGVEDALVLTKPTLNVVEESQFGLIGIGSVPASGAVEVQCNAAPGADGVGVTAKVNVVRIG